MKAMFADGEVLGGRKVAWPTRFLQVLQMISLCWILLSTALGMWAGTVAVGSELHTKLKIFSWGFLFVAVGLCSVTLPLMFFRKEWE